MKLVLTLTQDNNTVVAQVVRPITNANLPRLQAALRARHLDPQLTDVEVFQLWAQDVVDALRAEVVRFESQAAAAAITPVV